MRTIPKRSTDAVDAAIRYFNNGISRESLECYVKGAYEACSFAHDSNYALAAVRCAANAAYFAVYAAGNASLVAYNASAAAYNATFIADVAGAARKAVQYQTAEICRIILTEEVFDKVKYLQDDET